MLTHAADLELATRLAHEAGRAILAVDDEARARPTTKSDESPVTAADLASDRVIREGLAHLGDPIITEETWRGASVGPHPRAWFVDPIDGTEDFIAGRADYCVQIGLCVDGVPALGVIHQPSTGATWRGVVTSGLCEAIDGHGRVHRRRVDTRGLPQRPRIAISVSHPSQVVDYIVEELGGVPVPKGSVGLKIGLIVDGEADAYLTASKRIKVWDTCAPAAVLLAAGGLVTSLVETSLRFDGPAAHDAGVCAWTPAARAALNPKVQEAVVRFSLVGPSR
ncbi:MAG: 3'(2'),5'-bisphosphate nucleotidase CysQ [Deltaproteobacteria bacterium]|nr:3'(2'),5'-bisphosphate nucleotidase CysQ [Deltaproteobacteria bacterium]